MRRSSKQVGVSETTLTLTGGLNYSQTPSNIADNELTRAYNFIYDPNTDKLVTRPGTTITSTGVFGGAITGGIRRGYYYRKNSTTAYHVAAGNDKLYYLSSGSWVEIGSIASGSTPDFITFNGKLLVADGGTGIKTWDGTTYTAIATSPNADALGVIGNRVVANHVGEYDSVYLSKVNDESNWDTTGSAVGLKAGYGDLLRVNAFAASQDDLVISKVSAHKKMFYRLNTASNEPAGWSCVPMSGNNGAANNRSMLSAYNSIFFMDTNGFKSVAGTTRYGDLEIDPTGRKINSLFTTSAVINGLYFTPSYNAVWGCLNDNVICYSERLINGSFVPAFTTLYFNFGRVTSMYEANNVVYLTANNGRLYQLEETLSTDPTGSFSTANFISRVRTKLFTFPTDALLRRTKYSIKPILDYKVTVYSAKNDTEKTWIGEFSSTAGEQEYVYDANGYLNDATEYLNTTSNESIQYTNRNRTRDYQLGLEFECTKGRIGIDWAAIEFASLEGGE
jgi:hypothetical protein